MSSSSKINIGCPINLSVASANFAWAAEEIWSCIKYPFPWVGSSETAPYKALALSTSAPSITTLDTSGINADCPSSVVTVIGSTNWSFAVFPKNSLASAGSVNPGISTIIIGLARLVSSIVTVASFNPFTSNLFLNTVCAVAKPSLVISSPTGLYTSLTPPAISNPILMPDTPGKIWFPEILTPKYVPNPKATVIMRTSKRYVILFAFIFISSLIIFYL